MWQRFIELYENSERFVVFDVETIGAQKPIIVEIGAIEAGKEYARGFRTFHKILQFCPDSWWPYRYELRLHKIPAQTIENGEEPQKALTEFLEFIAEATLICHTSYDIRVTRGNLETHQMQTALDLPLWTEFIDSHRLARQICPDLSGHSLSCLAENFQLQNPQAHRALADAWTTKRIIGKLLQKYYQGKQNDYGHQQRISTTIAPDQGISGHGD